VHLCAAVRGARRRRWSAPVGPRWPGRMVPPETLRLWRRWLVALAPRAFVPIPLPAVVCLSVICTDLCAPIALYPYVSRVQYISRREISFVLIIRAPASRQTCGRDHLGRGPCPLAARRNTSRDCGEPMLMNISRCVSVERGGVCLTVVVAAGGELS
jgi:hypothetical protein